jgi:hypothetical protein
MQAQPQGGPPFSIAAASFGFGAGQAERSSSARA